MNIFADGLPSRPFAHFTPLNSAESSNHADLHIGDIPELRLNATQEPIWPGNVLLKEVGQRRELNQAECQKIFRGFREYRLELTAATNWRLPALHELGRHSDGQKWQIWILEEYIRGSSLGDAITSPRRSRLDRIDIYSNIFSMLMSHPALSRAIDVDGHALKLLRVGVDLKPSNVLIGEDTAIYLVDQFPPLLLRRDGGVRYLWPKLHSFSERKLQILCFTRGGAIARLMRLLQLRMESAEEKRRLKLEIFTAIDNAPLPAVDHQFLKREVEAGFPTLNSLYS